MAPRKPRFVKPIVEENFRILIEHKIEQFLNSTEETGLTFPNTLTAHERAYIHVFVADKNIKSKSHGKGANRQLTLYKKSNTVPIYDCIFDISEETRRDIFTLLKAQPVSQREKADLNPENQMKRFQTKVPPYRFSVGTFTKSYLSVPPLHQNPSLQSVRRKLPVYEFRNNILETINNNQVVVISGETGSGKTTQIPQYILEDCNQRNKKCRIICTQPRRLSAVSVAERVAAERGENLGHVIGYQIRLESRTSPTSNLIYCTNGILLRCLMGESRNELFASMTHIIVDEVHERDKFSDFLLIALRRYVQENPNLRIILMSATIESEIFSEYFYNCKILKIPGRLYHVQSLYLDDILPVIGYMTPQMRVILKNTEDATIAKNEFVNAIENVSANTEIDKETTQLLNDTLESCMNGVEDSFSQFFYMVEGENIPVDYRHQKNAMTVLMIASYLGNKDMINVLLNLGADPYLKSCCGYNSIDIARTAKQLECVPLLESARPAGVSRQPVEDNSRNNKIVEAYQITTNDDHVDYSLIYAIIKYVHTNLPSGSILVFLPGYEDIIETNELISKGIVNGDISEKLVIFMLHSNMPTMDQKSVFRSPPFGSRKIILSTNIAETSITIDDVVYVIDSGKVKQKSYDALTNSVSLAPTWISQACSTQRTGRAGRTQPGKSFNIFSKNRFDSMEKYTVPEILRIPLTEICLQAKLLTSSQTPIIDFLSEALQKPSVLNITQSITLLKSIDALDRQENLTELGTHLVDLPVDVQLGKILIYSIMLKCLDPILTIVSALSVKDPFILPPKMADRRSAITVMKELSEDTYSDHLAILRIFQKWLNNKSIKNDKKFCRDNYISSGVMETICGVRSQILGYLRAVGLIHSHGPGNIHTLNKYSHNWPVVKACLVAGLYPNLCRIDKENCQLKSKFDNKILIHQSSVLRDAKKNIQKNYNNLMQLPSDWIVFGEKTKFGRFNFIKQNTVVSSLTVALFCGSIYQDEATALEAFNSNEDSQSEDDDENPHRPVNADQFTKTASDWTRLVLDNWTQFTLNTETAYMIFHLRQKFNALFLKFIQNPRNYFKTENDSKIISIISKVLLQEDKHNNFVQPERIGERPKAVVLNLSSDVNFGIQDKNDYTNINKKISEISLNSSASLASSSSSSGPTTSSAGSVGPYFRNNENFNQMSYSKNAHPSDINKIAASDSLQNKIKKFFIVKAASKEQVLGLFVTQRWDFSQSVLGHVQKLVRDSNSTIAGILFFHVYHENSFVGIGRLIATHDRYRINCLSKKSYSFGELRKLFKNVLNGDEYSFKAIDRCYDGEELPSIIGDILYELLVDRTLDRN